MTQARLKFLCEFHDTKQFPYEILYKVTEFNYSTHIILAERNAATYVQKIPYAYNKTNPRYPSSLAERKITRHLQRFFRVGLH